MWNNQELTHYGIPGMKWGVRKDPEKAAAKAAKKAERKAEKRKKMIGELSKDQKAAFKSMSDRDKERYFSDRFWNGKSIANRSLDIMGGKTMWGSKGYDAQDARAITNGEIAVATAIASGIYYTAATLLSKR
jgi:hypothetical protein